MGLVAQGVCHAIVEVAWAIPGAIWGALYEKYNTSLALVKTNSKASDAGVSDSSASQKMGIPSGNASGIQPILLAKSEFEVKLTGDKDHSVRNGAEQMTGMRRACSDSSLVSSGGALVGKQQPSPPANKVEEKKPAVAIPQPAQSAEVKAPVIEATKEELWDEMGIFEKMFVSVMLNKAIFASICLMVASALLVLYGKIKRGEGEKQGKTFVERANWYVSAFKGIYATFALGVLALGITGVLDEARKGLVIGTLADMSLKMLYNVGVWFRFMDASEIPKGAAIGFEYEKEEDVPEVATKKDDALWIKALIVLYKIPVCSSLKISPVPEKEDCAMCSVHWLSSLSHLDPEYAKKLDQVVPLRRALVMRELWDKQKSEKLPALADEIYKRYREAIQSNADPKALETIAGEYAAFLSSRKWCFDDTKPVKETELNNKDEIIALAEGATIVVGQDSSWIIQCFVRIWSCVKETNVKNMMFMVGSIVFAVACCFFYAWEMGYLASPFSSKVVQKKEKNPKKEKALKEGLRAPNRYRFKNRQGQLVLQAKRGKSWQDYDHVDNKYDDIIEKAEEELQLKFAHRDRKMKWDKVDLLLRAGISWLTEEDIKQLGLTEEEAMSFSILEKTNPLYSQIINDKSDMARERDRMNELRMEDQARWEGKGYKESLMRLKKKHMVPNKSQEVPPQKIVESTVTIQDIQRDRISEPVKESVAEAKVEEKKKKTRSQKRNESRKKKTKESKTVNSIENVSRLQECIIPLYQKVGTKYLPGANGFGFSNYLCIPSHHQVGGQVYTKNGEKFEPVVVLGQRYQTGVKPGSMQDKCDLTVCVKPPSLKSFALSKEEHYAKCVVTGWNFPGDKINWVRSGGVLTRENCTHNCSTVKGSSGSPVLDDEGFLIGMHIEGNPNRYCSFDAGTVKWILACQKKEDKIEKTVAPLPNTVMSLNAVGGSKSPHSN